MSGELFEEGDHIVAWGNPLHGYREADGGALKSASGVNINLSELTNNIPADGWNRVSDFGMPAITTTAAELAAGMTWNNYVIWSGRARRYMPVHGGPGPLEVGALAWPYQTADGTIWWLEVSFANPGMIDIVAWLQPMFFSPPGSSAILCERFAAPQDVPDQRFVNFSLSGNLAALHLCSANPTFAGALDAQYIYDITVSGGNATTAPVTAAALAYDPSNMTETIDSREYTLSDKKINVSQETFYWSNDDPYPGSGNCERMTVGTAPSDIFHVSGPQTDRNVLAVVFDENGSRRVLSHESWIDTRQEFLMTYTGYYDLAPDLIGRLGDWTVYEYTSTDYQRVEERLCLDGSPVVSVLVMLRDNFIDATETGDGVGGTVTTVINESRSEESLPLHYSNPTLHHFLVNGEVGMIIDHTIAETDNGVRMVAYLSPRHGDQFAYGSFPGASDLTLFSTHPTTGVFDPGKDRYF